MFGQLRRQVRRKRRRQALLLLAAGLLVLAIHLPGLRMLAAGPADLYTLGTDGLEGRYVAARVDIIYDWYAETVRQDNNGGQYTLRREYIIPVGDSGYMGMEVLSPQLADAEAVLSSTGAVMAGTARVNRSFPMGAVPSWFSWEAVGCFVCSMVLLSKSKKKRAICRSP